MLGMGESQWACFERLDLIDHDAMRRCYEQISAFTWYSDDGQRSLHSPTYYYHAHKYFAALIAPAGTFELDALFGDCPYRLLRETRK